MDGRVAEQLASGNIEQTPEGFRLTERGLAFVTSARAVGAIFSVDQRFLSRRGRSRGLAKRGRRKLPPGTDGPSRSVA